MLNVRPTFNNSHNVSQTAYWIYSREPPSWVVPLQGHTVYDYIPCNTLTCATHKDHQGNPTNAHYCKTGITILLHYRVTFWTPRQQWRRLLWSISAPSSFGNSVPSTAAISLTVKISKITKEKHILYFHLSHQNHAKNPRKQIRTVYELKSPGQGR